MQAEVKPYQSLQEMDSFLLTTVTSAFGLTEQFEEKPITMEYISHYEWIPFTMSYHNAMVYRDKLRAEAPYMKVRTRESTERYERAFRAGK